MSVLVKDTYAVAGTGYAEADSPHILYENLVRDADVTADEEATDQPVTLLQHYFTAPGERWAGTSTSTQNITFDFNQVESWDAIGIAAHNLGATGGGFKLQESSDGSTWSDVFSTVTPADDETIMVLFGTVTKRHARLVLTPGTAAPEIGVVYIGEVMACQHTIYAGHKPVTLGRSAKRIGQVSDTGHFLGMVVTSQSDEFRAELTHIPASWYRNTFRAFEREALTRPFFWAWRPVSYSDEVGFAWLTAPAKPQNTGPGDYMAVTLNMRAFVG